MTKLDLSFFTINRCTLYPITFSGYFVAPSGKEDEGYWRMIRSNTVGGFYSSGGGSQNIHNLIYSMLNLHLSPSWSQISFLNVSPEEWEKLKKGCWYNKGMCGYVGAANYEARDIFESWCERAQEM